MTVIATTPLQIAGNATTTAPGLTQLAGDLAGTATAPVVARLNGVALTGTPSSGQVPTATSASTATWQTPSGGGSSTPRVVTGTYGGTITPNGATTDIFRVVLTGNPTIAVPSGTPVDGQKMQIHIIQDGTGGRTVAWGTGFAFSTSIPSPTLSTTANKTDILGFQYSAAASQWRCLGYGLGY